MNGQPRTFASAGMVRASHNEGLPIDFVDELGKGDMILGQAAIPGFEQNGAAFHTVYSASSNAEGLGYRRLTNDMLLYQCKRDDS